MIKRLVSREAAMATKRVYIPVGHECRQAADGESCKRCGSDPYLHDEILGRVDADGLCCKCHNDDAALAMAEYHKNNPLPVFSWDDWWVYYA